MKNNTLLSALVELLIQGNAHADFDSIIKNVPAGKCGLRPDDLPYSIWDLVEHLRITQWDILEFSRNPDHESPKWPDEYWVKKGHQPTKQEWNESIATIKRERDEFVSLLKESDDLFKPFPWSEAHHLLQEALTLADHDTYHLGQILVLRRLLGVW